MLSSLIAAAEEYADRLGVYEDDDIHSAIVELKSDGLQTCKYCGWYNGEECEIDDTKVVQRDRNDTCDEWEMVTP